MLIYFKYKNIFKIYKHYKINFITKIIQSNKYLTFTKNSILKNDDGSYANVHIYKYRLLLFVLQVYQNLKILFF